MDGSQVCLFKKHTPKLKVRPIFRGVTCLSNRWMAAACPCVHRSAMCAVLLQIKNLNAFFFFTSTRKAAQGWKKARTMQAYPESGVQNNKGWVSTMVARSSPPILCLKRVSGFESTSCTESGLSCFSVKTAYIQTGSRTFGCLLLPRLVNYF